MRTDLIFIGEMLMGASCLLYVVFMYVCIRLYDQGAAAVMAARTAAVRRVFFLEKATL